MFKFASVRFPESPEAPTYVYKAVLMQNLYQHELLLLTFKDWNPEYETVRPGTPVEVQLTANTTPRDFFGYVHHITPMASPGKMFTEVVCIGGSFPMKQASQKVYRDHTADQVVKEMCIKHRLKFEGVPHPRVFDMISQAGYTDWQLAVRLAKQIGYTLRAENTEVYFEPILNDYSLYREQAKRFTLRDAGSPDGSTLYSFKPIIGDSIEYDGDMKAAVSVSGVDRFAKAPIAQTKQKRNKTTKKRKQDEFFDRFNGLVVAPSSAIASFEADAAEARNSFPYRGTATVLGDTTIRPNMPVYLSGIGGTYSGYWTVLSAEHVITEAERNTASYVTNLVLGTDSLGGASTWVDGRTIGAPSAIPKRVVRPGKNNTAKRKERPKLKRASKRTNNKKTASFGSIGNRKKDTAKAKQPSTWASAKKTAKVTFTDKRIKSPAVANRVRNRALR